MSISPRLPLATKLVYAIGNFGFLTLMSASGFFLMVFYTDVAMVPPALAASALLIGKIWDVVNDPLLGYISDRTHSRWGRRRVYLIYGALPLFFATVLLWAVPAGLSHTMAFVWIMLSYIVFDTVFTLVQMPYSMLSAELTKDYDERTSLIAIAMIGALLGFATGSIFMPKIVASQSSASAGYLLAGIIYGGLASTCIAFVAWRVKEPMQTNPPNTPSFRDFISSMRIPLKNAPFMRLILAATLSRLGLTLLQTSVIYYVIYRLQLSKDDVPKLMGVMMLSILVCIYVWKLACDYWNKHIAYIVGLTLTAISLLCIAIFEPRSSLAIYITFAVIGIGLSAQWVAPFAMLPDTIDYGKSADGRLQTGVHFALYGLSDKIARTIGTVSVGWMLALVGYIPNIQQQKEVLFGIDLMFAYLPATCLLLAVPILLRYPLTRENHTALHQSM